MKEAFSLNGKDITFEEAIKYFGEKLPIKADDFYKLPNKYKAITFTVSGYTKAQVLEKFHQELLEAIKNGTTMRDFKNNMNEFLENKGYEGISAFQADNIFRTNVQSAYDAGHYEQLTDPDVMNARPIWLYDAVEDKRTRYSHLLMNNRAFRADNPIWDTWYPPNGFKCRCTVISLSVRQAKAMGIIVENEAPIAGEIDGKFISIFPDPKFAYNPAKIAFKPDLKGYHEPIKNVFESIQS